MPTFLGAEDFEGQLMHSNKYDKATDHLGKKVVVIGSCTSSKQERFSVIHHLYNKRFGLKVTIFAQISMNMV